MRPRRSGALPRWAAEGAASSGAQAALRVGGESAAPPCVRWGPPGQSSHDPRPAPSSSLSSWAAPDTRNKLEQDRTGSGHAACDNGPNARRCCSRFGDQRAACPWPSEVADGLCPADVWRPGSIPLLLRIPRILEQTGTPWRGRPREWQPCSLSVNPLKWKASWEGKIGRQSVSKLGSL